MKKILLPAAVLLLMMACSKPKPKPQPAPPPPNHSLVIGNPLDCGIEGMQIFPVGCNYTPAVFENEDAKSKMSSTATLNFACNTSDFYDRNANVEYTNGNEREFDIRNILFYDLATGKTYPLHSDTMHILSFALHKEYKQPLIFYRVVKKDINQDTVFDSRDAVMLYMSDLNGKNFVQCTPETEQFVDYFYYEKMNKILVKTMVDGDTNKRFTSSDETNFREVLLGKPTMGREIFGKSLKDSLRVD